MGATVAAAQIPAADSIMQVAVEEFTRLETFDGTDRSRQELLLRNLTRYFALYAVPSNPEDLSRLLGTLERICLRSAGQIHELSNASALQAGSPEIGVSHVDSILARILHNEPTEYQEVIFFPHAPETERVIVETIDLQAFADTGFGWQILGQLADSEALQDRTALPLNTEAVHQLNHGISQYGLLILRVGAWHARQEFSRALGSRHLRAAADR